MGSAGAARQWSVIGGQPLGDPDGEHRAQHHDRGEQEPIVTVVATVVMLSSVIPVWVAQRLTTDDGPLTGGTR